MQGNSRCLLYSRPQREGAVVDSLVEAVDWRHLPFDFCGAPSSARVYLSTYALTSQLTL
ncbi:MAG: hypothetical protein ACI9R3_004693 [Verrucomicrobiales bacterium]|jgi:hypothetical protein